VNLLLKRRVAINTRGPSGISPLQSAAAEGHAAVVRLLLHKGAQIDQISQLHGTALCAAASRGRLEVVKVLLRKGAKIDVVGGPYGNALQAAAWAGKRAVVDALLDAGAEINAQSPEGCTALQIASFAGNTQVIRSLLVRGAHVNAPGEKYGSALKAANDHGRFEAVTLLLQFGASDPSLLMKPNSQFEEKPGSRTMSTETTAPWKLTLDFPEPINLESMPDDDTDITSRGFSNSSAATPPISPGPSIPFSSLSPLSPSARNITVMSSPPQPSTHDRNGRPTVNNSGFSVINDPQSANIE